MSRLTLDMPMTDDAGRPTRMLWLRRLWVDPRMEDIRFRAVVGHVQRLVSSASHEFLVALLGCIPVWAVGTLGIFRVSFEWDESEHLWPPMIAWVFWSMLVMWIWGCLCQMFASRSVERFADAMIQVGLCPACTQSLVECDESDAGLIACHNCGACWDSNRVGAVQRFRHSPGERSAVMQVLRNARSYLGEGFIIDDWGRVCTVSLRFEVSGAEASTDDRLERMAAAQDMVVVARRRLRRVALPLGLLGSPMLLAAALGSEPFRQSPLGAAAFLGGLVFSALGIVLLFFSFVVPSGDEAKKIALSNFFCAWCMEDLTGIDAQDDGCTICPECGAAWELGNADGEELPRDS